MPVSRKWTSDPSSIKIMVREAPLSASAMHAALRRRLGLPTTGEANPLIV